MTPILIGVQAPTESIDRPKVRLQARPSDYFLANSTFEFAAS